MKKRFLVSFLMTFLLFAVGTTSVFAVNCTQDNDNDRWYVNDTSCDLPLGAKGFEEARCDGDATGVIDCTTDPGNLVCNENMAGAEINGKNINPGQIEKADNGIDEDCDGKDGSLVLGNESNANLADYIEKFINLLSGLVGAISAAVLIWGGIMFATAAGSDDKIRKAKKTMLGAIVGLVVALSAWVIVGYVIEKFV